MKTVRVLFAAMLATVLLCAVLLPTHTLQAQEPPYSSLTTNLQTIWASGAPGPLKIVSPTAVPIAMGNDTTASFPSTLLVAGTVGSGRFVAIGHEGIFTDAVIPRYNNSQFFVNSIRFLDKNNRKTIKILGGHAEWLNFTNMSVARSTIQQQGYTVLDDRTPVTSTSLSGIGVVLIGNAWSSFTALEVQALQRYIQEGGSLLIAGLSWSWTLNRPNQVYPMEAIGAMCGIEWQSSMIQDRVNQLNNSPLFTVFYPQTLSRLPTLESAMAFIRQAFVQNNSTLLNVLQTQSEFRTQFIRNLRTLSDIIEQPSRVNGGDSAQSASIAAFFSQLIQDFPALLRKGTRYTVSSTPVMTWVREKIQMTYINSIGAINTPLSQSARQRSISTLGLQGLDAEIMLRHGVLTLDNSSLSERQKTVIQRYLELTPAQIRNIRYILFESLLGAYPQPALPVYPGYSPINTAFAAPGYPLINNFSDDLGQTSENQFPNDVQARVVSSFSAALGHEMTHNIDFNYVDKRPLLKDRLITLRTAATNDQELLRSMVGVQFFTRSPREFIASIANQWFTDSYQTVLLGLSRFDRNFRQPINQALFFADLFSNETDTTQFFTTSHLGDVTGISVPLLRNAQRQITGLTYKDTTYRFTLDGVGNVVAWTRTVRIPNRAPLITISQTLITTSSNIPLSLILGINDESPNTVTLTVMSSNPALLTAQNIVVTGSGQNRTVTISPIRGQYGESRIQLTALDQQGLSSTTLCTVRVLNVPPVLGNLPSTISTIINRSTSALLFINDDTPERLTLTLTSSNPALLPSAVATIEGTGNTSLLRLTPVANTSGTARVILTASDGNLTTTSTFTFVVNNTPPTVQMSVRLAAETIINTGVPKEFLFTVTDENVGTLKLTVASSNHAAVPPNSIIINSSGAAAAVGKTLFAMPYSLTITALPGQVGNATITLTLRDEGGLTRTQQIVLRVVNSIPQESDYAALVANLRTVWAGGTPSTMRVTAATIQPSRVLPIIAGNTQTASNPSIFAFAGQAGRGRFIALGHEGVFADDYIRHFDNLTLLTNAMRFLDYRQTKRIRILTGHREWLNANNTTTASATLQQQGYKVEFDNDLLSSATLGITDVLIIGIAWSNFTATELQALQSYINSGGSVLAIGVGWSWQQYAPTQTYPMRAIGSLLGVEWMTDYITDTVHHRNNSPLFTRFYPILPLQTAIPQEQEKPVAGISSSANSSENLETQEQYVEEMLNPNSVTSLTVYPNPTAEAFTLRYILPESEVVTVELIRLDGSRVATLWHGNQDAGEHQIRYSFDNLPNSVYMCRIIGAKQYATVKISVQR